MAEHFTAHADERIDSRIRRDLDMIVRCLSAAAPGFDLVALVGAFGRGEGSVVEDGDGWRPLNDYDLVLVHPRPAELTGLKAAQERLARALGLSHVDVEVLARSCLKSLPRTMHSHDLVHGHRVLAGDPAVLSELPPVTGADVDLGAARMLLFNRLTCLLEEVTAASFAVPPEGPAAFRMAYMAHKVMLATAASRLARAGRYHVHYRERAARFAELASEDPDPVALVNAATRFKLEPPPAVPDPRPLWFAVRDRYLAELRICMEVTHAAPLPSWDLVAARHEGNRARDRLRKVKWWLFDRAKYEDIRVMNRRVDIELAEIFLTAAVLPGGFAPDLVAAARRRLAPHARGPLADWEACRAAAVRADLTWVHPILPEAS